MELNEWLDQLRQAYQVAGVPLSKEKLAFLQQDVPAMATERWKEIAGEAVEVMTRFFFRKVVEGGSFGSATRIAEQFGSSLEQNYGRSSGPFLDMARTYWTYKVELNDIMLGGQKLALYQVLLKIEVDIGSVFFPTPGPIKMPISLRMTAQRSALQKYAPSFDIERFLSDSPILNAQASQGCLLALLAVPIMAFFA